VADLESVVADLESGSVRLSDGCEERVAAAPDEATFEAALERQPDADTGRGFSPESTAASHGADSDSESDRPFPRRSTRTTAVP
jgi:hypothetical protein